MTETEGRTSKIAAAIARSGQATAPAADGLPRRRALPMNGTIRAGRAQAEQTVEDLSATQVAAAQPEIQRDSPRQTPHPAPPASSGTATQADRAAVLPARRLRSSRRRRRVVAAMLVTVLAAGAVLALRPWPGGTADFVEQAAVSPATTSEPSSDTVLLDRSDPAPARDPEPVPAEPVGADPVRLSPQADQEGLGVPQSPDQVAPLAVPTQSDAPVDAPPVQAAQADASSGPARPVAAVVPAGIPAARLAPSAAPVRDQAVGQPSAPRVQPSVVTGTEPPLADLAIAAPTVPDALPPDPPVSPGTPSESPGIDAAFDAPHNVILHYNPATSGAAEEATRLAAALTAAGAQSVTTATVPFTISSTHIRQYHDGDASLARAVSDQTDGGIEIRDFTDYSPRPAPGLIEVWMASG
ncbi:MAG: hypothetical protein NXH97_04885 [Rhodobacteraceae bacterium]|nr:hypothetical protein [Paracoccaceae bacterium]